MGEFAGASELVWRALRLVAYHWTKRGRPTAISDTFIDYTGAKDLSDFLEGINLGYYEVSPDAAPLIFEVARAGDKVAQELINWAGVELGEMANAVIRQLDFEDETFDVVLSGSLFKAGPILIDPMWQTITNLAPNARLVHLKSPPVIGAVVLALEHNGQSATPEFRQTLTETIDQFLKP
jgi:N-acetylglucosamine kinase-like BadF-type ATPase